MEFHVIIPARYASTRFPGKVLEMLGDRTVLQHVHEKAIDSGAMSVTIATEDDRVREVAESFGANVIMTSAQHVCGTERVAEAAEALHFEDHDIIVNCQADEPFMPSRWIYDVAKDLSEAATAKVSTLSVPVTTASMLQDPNIVKVVCNLRGQALYFSRAPMPWARDGEQGVPGKFGDSYQRHVGIYAYRVGLLAEYVEWSMSPLESLECLEQLRILWQGRRIHVKSVSGAVPISIDTPEDLAAAQKKI